MKLFLVEMNGVPSAAYPRRVQAEVYASGFSSDKGIKIIEGVFKPFSQPEDSTGMICKRCKEPMTQVYKCFRCPPIKLPSR